MGIWVYYFLIKLGLFWHGSMELSLLPNLAFAIWVVFPLKRRALQIVRQLIAIPLAFALFYHDTFFPPIARVAELIPNLRDFSLPYVSELLGRVLDPVVIEIGIMASALVYLLGRWIRLSTFVVLSILLVPSLKQKLGEPLMANSEIPAACADGSSVSPNQSPKGGRLTEAELDRHLSGFYDNEARRRLIFKGRPAASPLPFDIIFLHVCSLAWSDIDPGEQNQLFKPFDVVFKNFNSAASYSGPAAIRLLRSSCGQQPHKQLFSTAADGCFLFDELASNGYVPQFVMNHDGHFGGFIDNVRSRSEGGLNTAPLGQFGASSNLKSFDGTPIFSDFEVLSGWWSRRLSEPGPKVALYYNTISLHDGNVLKGHESESSTKTFPQRMHRLMDDVARFTDLLDRSGQPVMLVLVAEHGAAIHGDHLQIQGMREIPSPQITQVPLAIKFLGLPAIKPQEQITSERNISYLGMADFLRQLLNQSDEHATVADLAAHVLETDFVSANEDTTLIRVGQQFMLKEGSNAWKEYQ